MATDAHRVALLGAGGFATNSVSLHIARFPTGTRSRLARVLGRRQRCSR